MAGQIRRRGDRTWLVRVYLGRHPATGARRWLSKTVHGTRRDAEVLLHRLLRDRDLGALTIPSAVTLAEFVDRWLEDASHRVRPQTLDWYASRLRRWVLPVLGTRRLPDLTALDVQELYRGLLARGLSPTVVRHVHTCLKAVLRQAVKWSLLPRDPMSQLKPPRAARREVRALSPEEARRFLEAAKQDSAWPLWWLLLETGMRPSEALALRWEDVDLAARVVRVRRSLVRVGRTFRFEEPKTSKARRSVPISEGLARELVEHRRRIDTLRERAGDLWEELGLVFPSEVGRPLRLENLRSRNFTRILNRAGISGLRIYDLRHTSASLLLLTEEHPKVVAERLGHATVHMTLDTYSHVLPTLQRRATERIARLLGAGGDGGADPAGEAGSSSAG